LKAALEKLAKQTKQDISNAKAATAIAATVGKSVEKSLAEASFKASPINSIINKSEELKKEITLRNEGKSTNEIASQSNYDLNPS
jgi:hypothetical protein